MDSAVAARASFGTSLAFHIIFASFGVGLPLLFCIAEGIGLRKRDATWYILARRWSRAAGILFVIGAISGTTLSFELGLLWPRFMAFASGIFGLPFALEGFAFFLEAIFFGLYLYGWERLSPLTHWLTSIPIVVSGAMSAVFVVTANAWMNVPTGFQLVNGKPTKVDPLAAMFNAASPTQAAHMLIAAYQVTGFAVAAIYAVGLLRGRDTTYNRRGLVLSMVVATVMAPLQVIAGSLIGMMVAVQQPAKLAAMEAFFHTTTDASLTLFGWVNPSTQQVYFAITIPKLLSFLAFNRFNATVTGLDAFPRADWPNIPIVHYAFDIMATLGGLMVLVPIWFWWVYFRHRPLLPRSRWLLWVSVLTGFASVVALEAGWVATELGRQPWIIYNIMLTSDGVTLVPGVGFFFFIFLGIYLVLGVATVALLLRLARERKAFVAAAHGVEEPKDEIPPVG
jgi:cytochrome d ubiquinol oxidase subunit I